MSRPLLVMAVVLSVCVMTNSLFNSNFQHPDYKSERVTHLRVITYTRDIKHAHTVDPVTIAIKGSEGWTPTMYLDNPGEDRAKGSVDTYWLPTKYVGTIVSIKVTAGAGRDAWALNKIEIEPDEKEFLFESLSFGCGCVFDWPGTWFRYLSPKKITKRRWKITTYTGWESYADSNDATWIQLRGTKGVSDFMSLNKQHNKMRHNAKSIYFIGVLDSIGILYAIKIRGSRYGDAWSLKLVEAETKYDERTWRYTFICNTWFEGDRRPWRTEAQFDLSYKKRDP